MGANIDNKFEKSLHGAFSVPNGAPNGSRTLPGQLGSTAFENGIPKADPGTRGVEYGTQNRENAMEKNIKKSMPLKCWKIRQNYDFLYIFSERDRTLKTTETHVNI